MQKCFQKYFIADYLTAAKLIPAIVILTFQKELNPGEVFFLFGIGELLDVLDGTASKKWPHPEWTEKLWFRKNIKLLESGTDLYLGAVGLYYIMTRIIDLFVGLNIFVAAAIVGIISEPILYGRYFGTPENAKDWSLIKKRPKLAKKVIGFRLMMYLGAVMSILLILIWYAPWPIALQIVMTVLVVIIGIIIIAVKRKEKRLEDVLYLLGIK